MYIDIIRAERRQKLISILLRLMTETVDYTVCRKFFDTNLMKTLYLLRYKLIIIYNIYNLLELCCIR